MRDFDREILAEVAVNARRDRDREGRIVPPAEWWDLPPEALDRLFAEQVLAREIERAADARGETGTVKAVLQAIAVMEDY